MQAEKVLQRGLEREPGSAIGKYYLGWAQFATNRLVEAERNVQQALLRNANFSQAHALLESIHRRIEERQNAVEAPIVAAVP